LQTESTLLFVVGGARGVLVARWMTAGLMRLVPRLPVQLALTPRVDLRALAFALAVSLLTGILAGLVTAVHNVRPAVAPELRGDVAGSGRRQRLRSGLLVGQMALSMLLLATGALFARALARARTIDPGFEPRGWDRS
jgi:hypothetical protein